MIGSQRDRPRPRRVEVGELDLVLRPDLVADHDLINVVKFVPVVLRGTDIVSLTRHVDARAAASTSSGRPRHVQVHFSRCVADLVGVVVAEERLELGTPRDGQIQRLRREEGPPIK